VSLAARLSIEDLSVQFRTRDGLVRAVERVGLAVGRGETVGLVGESGSGKTVTALAVMGLLPAAARVAGGRAVFEGRDLLVAPEAVRREIRGRALSMIFQGPRTALNPIRPVGRQIEDVLVRHAGLGRASARGRARDLLARVEVADPARVADAYPFELSGGMCQRVMIAIAVACAPALLIADEPTTGLDVTTAAVILDLLKSLSRAHEMATLLITHDLGVVAQRCDRIVVMHAGHVVETAPVAALFDHPRHPYTGRLIASTPRPGATLETLAPIPGGVPDLRQPLPVCRYRMRCERAVPVCDVPPLPIAEPAPGHLVACRFPA